MMREKYFLSKLSGFKAFTSLFSLLLIFTLMFASCQTSFEEATVSSPSTPTAAISMDTPGIPPNSDVSPAIKSPQDLPYLPTRKDYQEYKPEDISLGMTTAGTLVIENNCVRLLTDSSVNMPSVSILIIWPKDYSLSTNGTKTLILDDKSQPVAIIGDYVFLEQKGPIYQNEDKEKVNALLSSNLPEAITGPYELIGIYSSDPPLELISGDIPCYSKDASDSEGTTLEGTLIIDNGQEFNDIGGHLILDSGDNTYIQPIWPPGYSCKIIDYALQVVDQDNNPIAMIGNKIQISGFEIERSHISEYTKQNSALNKKLPYWFVDKIIASY